MNLLQQRLPLGNAVTLPEMLEELPLLLNLYQAQITQSAEDIPERVSGLRTARSILEQMDVIAEDHIKYRTLIARYILRIGIIRASDVLNNEGVNAFEKMAVHAKELLGESLRTELDLAYLGYATTEFPTVIDQMNIVRLQAAINSLYLLRGEHLFDDRMRRVFTDKPEMVFEIVKRRVNGIITDLEKLVNKISACQLTPANIDNVETLIGQLPNLLHGFLGKACRDTFISQSEAEETKCSLNEELEATENMTAVARQTFDTGLSLEGVSLDR